MADEAVNLGMLVLRLGLAAVFIAHGVKHALGREKTSNWFASIGFKQPQFQWFMSTATELGVGVLIALGFLTSLAAAGVVGIMFVAFWTVHRAAGFFITSFMKEGVEVEGWEYVFTLAIAAIALAAVGPGELSVDDALGIAGDLDDWVGLLIALGGAVVAAGQIATFFRPNQS